MPELRFMPGIRARARWAVLGVVSAVLVAGLWSPAHASARIDSGSAAAAQSSSFVSFDAFLSQVSGARYQSYAALGLTGAVHSEQAFEQMRSHIIGLYQGVEVRHSYVSQGSYFDCVAVETQPTVRALGIKVAAPPTSNSVNLNGARSGKGAASPLTLGLRDAFGNAVSCPAGTFPMLRLSLDRMTRFATLHDFLAKEPAGAGTAGAGIAAAAHRYAYGRQYVTNYGGNSWLNLWNPSGEFSLSQQWYSTGSGSTTQTVEGGWVHYPGKFGSKSVLFIFSTPDGYSHGCYNLECTGFVQTNSNWALGGAWSAYSSYGGTQWGFTMQWKYYNGNWWLFLQGAGAIEAVGYYPKSVFNGGQMASNATRTTFGGETFTSGTSWPQMGSGKFASAGFAQAAYQRTIFYIPQNVNGGTGVWSSLSTAATNPACYTIAYTPASSGGSWGTYFYFGGPGGNC